MSEAPPAAFPASRERYARPLFLATILTGSFLLFLVQPMIARMALPRLGGAPAVWNSAMLVYQALLLAGYAYAHYLARLRPRKQAFVHLALFAVAALWLPVGLSAAMPDANVSPALWAPWFLLSSMGPLFFIVSAQAPLMQRWYALETSRGEPYVLYAISNLGSFAGLLSYPLLVEPMLTLQQQSLAWSIGYIILILLVAGCALTIPASAVEAPPQRSGAKPAPRRVLHWIALAAIPSGLILSTTTHLTTDIVAIPMLWVVPLGLYLLSFVLAFATRRRAADLITALAPLVLLVAGGFAFSDSTDKPALSAALGLLLLFVIAVALHAELYRLRPATGHLTTFYLAMAFGGMLGGLFCAIVAPTLFDWAYEHPILLLGAAVLLPQIPLVPAMERAPLWLKLGLPLAALTLSQVADGRILEDLPAFAVVGASVGIALIALLFLGQRWLFAICLAALMMSYGGWSTTDHSWSGDRTRSYFGIYSVEDKADGSARMLTHGTTLHGVQNLAPNLQTVPTTYYAPKSGVGIAMGMAEQLYGPKASIGVIGLGSGTLACYAKPGQSWRFFEIDPGMVKMARSSGRFTFLSRCAPQAEIILGDARISMARQPVGKFNLLAVDAFSSDSVPMHLLTREAFQTYARAMSPDGILLIHISNRYLDLEPVVAANARADGWEAALLRYYPEEEDDDLNFTVSVWIALSRDPAKIAALATKAGPNSDWVELDARKDFAGWTDDYASILPLIDWTNF
jgi:SAM-dependent methyltransferase